MPVEAVRAGVARAFEKFKKRRRAFRKINSRLQGHPELGTTPGVENAAGAEGQGLSFSVGLGLAARTDHEPWRVYCIMGDGEQDVGQTDDGRQIADLRLGEPPLALEEVRDRTDRVRLVVTAEDGGCRERERRPAQGR